MRAPATLVDFALVIYFTAFFQATLFVASTLALAKALGTGLREAQIGAGRLWSFTLGETRVKLGWLWMFASVSPAGRGPADPYDGEGAFRRLALWRRILLLLGPWVTTFAVGAALLGPSRALTSCLRAASQFLFTMDVAPLLRGVVQVLDREGIMALVGVMLVKMTAVNLLLPALVLNLIQEVRNTPPPKAEDEKQVLPMLGLALGLLVSVSIALRFGWALYRMARS